MKNDHYNKMGFKVFSVLVGLVCFFPSVSLAMSKTFEDQGTLNPLVYPTDVFDTWCVYSSQRVLDEPFACGNEGDDLSWNTASVYYNDESCIFTFIDVDTGLDYSALPLSENRAHEKSANFIVRGVPAEGGSGFQWLGSFSFVPPNVSDLPEALTTATATTTKSMLPILALVIAVPLSFWVIIQIMGMFPKEEKKKRGSSHAENMEVIHEDWRARGQDLSRLHDLNEK